MFKMFPANILPLSNGDLHELESQHYIELEGESGKFPYSPTMALISSAEDDEDASGGDDGEGASSSDDGEGASSDDGDKGATSRDDGEAASNGAVGEGARTGADDQSDDTSRCSACKFILFPRLPIKFQKGFDQFSV